MGFGTKNNGSGWFQLAAAAIVLALGPTTGHAQIIYDYNIFWNNSATPGSPSSQFLGTTTAAACPAGYTTEILATTTYVNNSFVNPLLDLSAFAGNPGWDVSPNFQPQAPSPAFAGNPGHGKVAQVPADEFFQQTCFVGAIGPRLGDDWTQGGWTYFNQNGAGRTDIDYGKPLVIVDNHKFYENRTFGPDSNYLIRGNVRVKAQARLTIQAGTVVFEEKSTTGTMVVERGAFIDAQGTPGSPIIFTSDEPPGTQTPGSSGGLFINGRARVNVFGVCANGDSLASEGGNGGFFGGTDDSDSSGVLRYVRIEFAGVAVSANNESNSFTFNAIGNRTKIDHLQGHRGFDDNFEFFGGDSRTRYLLSTDNDDDGYDWQLGARGKAQFVIVRHNAINTGADKGIEADNDGTLTGTRRDSVSCSGRSHHVVSNFTFIGDRRSGPGFGGGPTHGVHLREGTAGTLINGITTDFKTSGLNIQHNETFQAHCVASPTGPGLGCDGSSVGVPIDEGRMFVTHGAPNPFDRRVAIHFALPRAGRVQVDVFGADGRLIETIADRQMGAGNQSVEWSAARSVPAGLYFYRVSTENGVSAGKIIRVE